MITRCRNCHANTIHISGVTGDPADPDYWMECTVCGTETS